MMIRAAILVAASALAQQAGLRLDEENFAQWRATIAPKAEELAFGEIPWRPAFWQGVLDAQRTQMPILLWAMNGHPLACT